MTDKLTFTELDFLTPEERAALAEDAHQVEGADDATDSGTQADASASDPDAPAAGTEQASDERADADAPSITTEATVQPVPLIKAESPQDVAAKLDDIKARKAALVEKFNDGDLNARDYTDQLEALTDEADAIKQALFKDRLSREVAGQQREQAWRAEVTAFLSEHPEVCKNEIAWGAYDLAVRAVTSASENSRLSDRQQLTKAHQLWADKLGITAPEKAPEAKTQASPPKPERKVPPTLARIPASDTQGTDEGKWDALDRLAGTDPDAYEQRLARLSPAELAAYERISG